MAGEKILSWDTARLFRYVVNVIRSTPATLPQSLTLQRVTATRKLTVEDELELSPQAISYLKKQLGL